MAEVYVDPESGDLIVEGMEDIEWQALTADLLGPSAPTVPDTCNYKGRWGHGPWESETDREQWVDPTTGLVCLVRRAHHGALCGYVGVPRSHPYWGMNHQEIDIKIRGGLNYSAPCDGAPDTGICHVPEPGEPDDLWWYGFDACDAYVPLYGEGPRESYVTLEHMRETCAYLAFMLKWRPRIKGAMRTS